MIICNACYGQDIGETTIGIITSKKHQDTIKCVAILKDKSTKRQYNAFIYNVMQEYKRVEQEPFAIPKYYFQHIKYLGQDKKPIPKSITVIQSTELK